MNLEQIMNEVKRIATSVDQSRCKEFLAIQVTLSDLQEVFYVELRDGKLSVEPYEYHDRQANLIITSDRFLKLINRQLNPVIAFTAGQLKVEGDLGAALELANMLQ